MGETKCKHSLANRLLWFLLQIAILLCILLPLLLTITEVKLSDFYQILIEDFWFYPKFWLSLVIAIVIGTGATIVALFASMGLKLGRIKWKREILFLLLVLMLMPLQTTLLPNYIGLRDLGLLDTVQALVLPMICSPFAVYLMYQYMSVIPDESIEAARMETSSVFRILFYVLLPQMKGSVAAVFVFMFAEGFNMIEQPLYYVKSDKLKPLSVLGTEYTQGDEHLIFAVGILCMIPVLLLYGFYEEELSEGIGRINE